MVNKTVRDINLVKENLQQVILSNNLVISKEDINYLNGFYLNNKRRIETNILENEYVGQSYHNILFVENLTGINKKVKTLSM